MQKITFILIFLSFQLNAQIKVFDNFENGNVEVIKIVDSTNTIYFRPSLKNNQNTTRCWYNFGITGYKQKDSLKLMVINEYIKSANFPVYRYSSSDWHHTPAQSIDDTTKMIKIFTNADSLYIAAGYPYTYSDMINYVGKISKSEYVDTQTFFVSQMGLRIPLITIYNKNFKQHNCVWIIGRQHAFESTLNYTLEGFINYFLDTNLKSKEFLKNNKIFIVPMIDVDNVFIGASGRMQKPVDYNRDWKEKPHWQIIKKLQNTIDSTTHKHNYTVFLDFHSTYPGTQSPTFAIFNDYDKKNKLNKNIKRFNKIFSDVAGYRLTEISSSQISYYADIYNSNKFSKFKKKNKFATTIETDWYYNHDNNELTKENLQKVGGNIAQALCLFVK